jgi:uncharacterized protein (TIGR03083 family)
MIRLSETPGTGLLVPTLLDALESESALLVRTAGERDPSSPVPFCADWTVRQLLTHLGFVYRWASFVVAGRRQTRPDDAARAALADPDPTDDAGVVERLELARRGLVTALRAAPPDLDCWTIWPASPAREFWVRRQLHETVVHRVDVQNAGVPEPAGGHDLTPSGTDITTDGVDEMIRGFAVRYSGHLRSPRPVTLALHAVDTDHRWWVRIDADQPRFGLGAPPSPADTEVRAGSGELLLLLWNRRTADGMDVRGNREVVELWQRLAHL